MGEVHQGHDTKCNLPDGPLPLKATTLPTEIKEFSINFGDKSCFTIALAFS
jgi:hypothetical protein